jgi:hypothetical protein
MDSRELEARSGKMWAMQASGGRLKGSVPTWVEMRVRPSGRLTEMPGETERTLVRGASVVT